MRMFGKLLLHVSIFGFFQRVFVSVVKEKAPPALLYVPRRLRCLTASCRLFVTSAYFKLQLRQSFSSRECFLSRALMPNPHAHLLNITCKKKRM